MTQSALSGSVASQTQRSPARVRRCASRSASTTRTASPASTARRTFAGLDVEATQTAPSARSISRPNPQTSKDTLDIIFSSESFQICADGPLGSTRECEEGCNFNNDCPIEQVRSLKKWRVGMRRKGQGRVGASWAGSGRGGDAYAAKTDSAFNPMDLNTIAFIVNPFQLHLHIAIFIINYTLLSIC